MGNCGCVCGAIPDPQYRIFSGRAGDARTSAHRPAAPSATTGAGPCCPTEPTLTFDQLCLAPQLVRALADCGHTVPTPIQEHAIPPLLARRDLIVGLLNEVPGIHCRVPGGAFYAWPNVTEACRITGSPEPEVFHTNEGHAGFLGIERIRELVVERLSEHLE